MPNHCVVCIVYLGDLLRTYGKAPQASKPSPLTSSGQRWIACRVPDGCIMALLIRLFQAMMQVSIAPPHLTGQGMSQLHAEIARARFVAVCPQVRQLSGQGVSQHKPGDEARESGPLVIFSSTIHRGNCFKQGRK